QGEQALASFLSAVVSAARPTFTADSQSELENLVGQALREQQDLGPATRPEPVFSPEGVIDFSFGHVESMPREGEQVVILSGGVSALYWDHQRELTIQMRGERMVLFLEQRDRMDAARSVSVGAV